MQCKSYLKTVEFRAIAFVAIERRATFAQVSTYLFLVCEALRSFGVKTNGATHAYAAIFENCAAIMPSRFWDRKATFHDAKFTKE